MFFSDRIFKCLFLTFYSRLFHSVACFVDGFDEDSRMLRRSLMRYMNLALILVLRSISSAVKQRFPTLEHVVEAGKASSKNTNFKKARSERYALNGVIFAGDCSNLFRGFSYVSVVLVFQRETD